MCAEPGLEFVNSCFFIYDMFNVFLLQLVKQPNFLPDSATTGPGFELERLSILGPFFALSVFAEDNVS